MTAKEKNEEIYRQKVLTKLDGIIALLSVLANNKPGNPNFVTLSPHPAFQGKSLNTD